MTQHTVYNGAYYGRQVNGALRSARAVVPRLVSVLRPHSVIDLGCGRGAWLRAWQECGVHDVHGVDGDYVPVGQLLIDRECFSPADLAQPVRLTRRWDLAQSLEVGEHLPEAAAPMLVASLVAAAPIIVFGAAVPGQGGASHVNEQPLEYWRTLFRAHDYRPFDWLRPQLASLHAVEPWYRYNTMLYAHVDAIDTLPEAVRASALGDRSPLRDGGSMAWRLRRALVRPMPRAMVDGIARGLAAMHARTASPTHE